MQLPECVTADEVKRVCNEIGLRDWSKITDPTVSGEEASTILQYCEYPGNEYTPYSFPKRFRS